MGEFGISVCKHPPTEYNEEEEFSYSIAPSMVGKQSLFSSYQVRTKKPDYY